MISSGLLLVLDTASLNEPVEGIEPYSTGSGGEACGGAAAASPCAASSSSRRRMSPGSPSAGGQSAPMTRAAKSLGQTRSGSPSWSRAGFERTPGEAPGLRFGHVAATGEIAEEGREILVVSPFRGPVGRTPGKRLRLRIAGLEHHVRLRSPLLGKFGPRRVLDLQHRGQRVGPCSSRVSSSAMPFVASLIRASMSGSVIG